MIGEADILCLLAQERYRNRAMWLNLWSILLFAFGAAVTVFLVLSVTLFIRQDWLPAALTTLSTIVQGVAIKWVKDRRDDAKTEEQEAYKDVADKCKDTRIADSLRQRLKLFGKVQ